MSELIMVQHVWKPVSEQILPFFPEADNRRDRRAVTTFNDSRIVGDVCSEDNIRVFVKF